VKEREMKWNKKKDDHLSRFKLFNISGAYAMMMAVVFDRSARHTQTHTALASTLRTKRTTTIE
jgi:hypothetical protein